MPRTPLPAEMRVVSMTANSRMSASRVVVIGGTSGDGSRHRPGRRGTRSVRDGCVGSRRLRRTRSRGTSRRHPGRVPTSLWAGSDEATREGLFKKAAAASLVKRVGDVDELTVDGVDLG